MSMDQAAGGRARPFLELTGVSKRFGGTLALDAIDWTVEVGEVHCLVGENGSGKSTLIKILAGVQPPDPGASLVIDGTHHENLTPHRAKELGIQVIFQDLSLFPNLTVWENIAIDQELHNAFSPPPRRAMREAARAALARLDANLPLDAIVGTLPIAQRQIVAICRGLAANARLLFMDEPTASLTHHEVELLLETVRRLKSQGVAIVFVSHRLKEVVDIAERVTVLRDGKKVGTFPAAEITDHRLTELMTGESIQQEVTSRRLDDLQPVVEVRGASRAGEFEDVSFTVHRGEIVSIIGLLGAGRTELALSLFGMTPLERGEIALEGNRVTLRSNQDALDAGIAYVSEDRLSLGLNLRQSISDNVAITVLDRLASKFGFVSPERRRGLAKDWVSRLGVRAADVDAPVQTLSGGNQQRIVLAKWIATEPKLLILDSPTVGVDIRNKDAIYRLIRDLAKEGMAILMISDEVPEVFFNSDRVLHMREGRIVGEFRPGETSETTLEEALYA